MELGAARLHANSGGPVSRAGTMVAPTVLHNGVPGPYYPERFVFHARTCSSIKERMCRSKYRPCGFRLQQLSAASSLVWFRERGTYHIDKMNLQKVYRKQTCFC